MNSRNSRYVSIGFLLSVIALFTVAAPSAQADVLVIDENTSGTLYDAAIDGFPGVATLDGVADFGGNALGIALQAGVTEERAIIEFPLSSLSSVNPADVISATLRFNIDDVVTTFGPGISFDGTAADTIILFDYAGDGVIDLPDFGNVAGAPMAMVDTTSFGVITDASLSVGGPVVIDVDVTAALTAHLTSSDTHMGVVMATNDDLTATSIDNLGDGGAGPAGVNGAVMPLLTIVTATGEPPVYTKDELKCQKGIAKNGAKYIKTLHKELSKCMAGVLAAVSKGGGTTKIAAKCQAGVDASSPSSKVSQAAAKASAGIVGACGGVAPADIGNPCDGLATTAEALADCVVADHANRVEQALRAEYSAGCDLLGAVSLDAGYPTLCTDD